MKILESIETEEISEKVSKSLITQITKRLHGYEMH